MTKEDRAVAILNVMTQTMSVIENGDQAEQVLCGALAKAAGADSAVVIGVDLGHRMRVHAAWPNQRHASALAEATMLNARRAESQLRGGHHPALGDVIWIGADLRDTAPDDDRGRLLALSRRGGFTADSRVFLAEATAPVLLLLPHVAEACRRAQATRTAADAAAALNLTAREVEVLQLLAEGLLARTIAARLGLSPRTVHKHLSNVYAKLGVHDRLVAVSIARAQGLIAA